MLTLMDNRLQDVFFQLLPIRLWGKGSLIFRSLRSNPVWKQIRSYAIKHTVERLIFDNFHYPQEDQLPSQWSRIKWAFRVDQIERHNSKMNEVLTAQYEGFKKIGLQPILQKGHGVATYYGIRMHRFISKCWGSLKINQ